MSSLFPYGITSSGFQKIISTQVMANENPGVKGHPMKIAARALNKNPGQVKSYAERCPERKMLLHNWSMKEIRTGLRPSK